MNVQLFIKNLLFILFFFISFNSISATWYVNDASQKNDFFTTAIGSNSNSGTSASPFATLKYALTKAGVNDVIYIDAGLYYRTDEDLIVNKAGIKIIGVNAQLTIFDDGSNGATGHSFIMIRANNVTLQDFWIKRYTLENGVGQAIDITTSAYTGVNITRIKVDNNGATTGSYPIEIGDGSSVTITGGGGTCNQTWENSGGIHVFGATTNVSFYQYLFLGNDRSDAGSALNVTSGTVNIYSSIFTSNSVHQDQPASCIYVTGGTVNVYDCSIDKNTYDQSNNDIGSTIKVTGGNFRITRSKLTNNTPLNSSDNYGTIGITGGNVIIDSCFFNGNVSNRAKDIYAKGGVTIVRNCTFASSGNLIGGASGTITIFNSGTPTLNSSYKTGVTFSNTNPPSYSVNLNSATPAIPIYKGTCTDTVKTCSPATVDSTSKTVNCPSNSAIVTVKSPNPSFYFLYSDTTSNWIDSASTSTPTLNIVGINATKKYYVKASADACNTFIPITVTYNCPACTPPTPTFTVSPGATSCPNTNITYTTDAGNTAYVWTFPGTVNVDYKIISGGTSTDNTVTIQWLTSGSKTVTVGYTKAGCASTSPASNTTTVSSPVVATFTLSPGANTCGNTNVTYTTQSGNSNYIWTFSGVLATDYTIISGGTTSDNTVTLQWLTAGSKTVTVGYTSAGCSTTTSATNSTNVTLKPAIPTVGSITQPTCSGLGSVVLSGLPAGSWTITPSTGNPVTNSGASYTFTGLNASTTYTFTVQDSKGCVSDPTVNVTMNSVPGKPVLSGATPICVGSTVQLNAWTDNTKTLASTPNALTPWATSDNTIATVLNGLVTGVKGGSATITYMDASNCTQTISIQVDPKAVGGVATPTASNLCTNTSTTITLSGNTGTIQWQTSLDGVTNWTNIAGATTSPYSTPTLTTGTYYYRALVTSGSCFATATSNVVTITVSALPVSGSSTATPDTICAGNTSILKLTGSTGNIQWQESLDGLSGWVNINGATGSTTTNCTTAVLNSTMYYKAVLSSGVCTPVESNILKVVVNPNVTASVTVVSNPAAVSFPVTDTLTSCPDYTIAFTANPGAGLSNISYQWKNKGVNILNATKSVYSSSSIKSGDIITVELTASGTCVVGSPVDSKPIYCKIPTNLLTLTKVDPSSCNASDGSIIANGNSTGKLVWGYSATPFVALDSMLNITLNKTIPNLKHGTYHVIFNDGNCSFPKDISLNDPNAPQDPVLSVNNTLPLCQGQSVTITANVADVTLLTGTTRYYWKKDGVDLAGQPQVGNTITVNATGDYSVYLVDGTCSSNPHDTSVVVTPIPSVPTIANSALTFCKSDNKKVSDLTNLITNFDPTKTITWYDLPIAGTASNNTDLLKTRSYYAEQTDGLCKSVSRLKVDVTVVNLSAPTLPGSNIDPTCQDSTGTVNIDMPSTGIWIVTATPNVGNPIIDTTGNLIGVPATYQFKGLAANTTYTFVVKDINSCFSPSSNPVTIGKKKVVPNTPVLDPASIYCSSNTYTIDQIKFSPAPTGTVNYYDVNDKPISSKTIVVPNTIYKFTFDNGICESANKLSTKITFDNGLPISDLDVSNSAICASLKPTFASLLAAANVTIPVGDSLLISSDPNGLSSFPLNAPLASLGGSSQTFYYNISNQNKCASPKFAKLTFKVSEGPSNWALQGPLTICANTNPTIAKLNSALVSGSGKLKWYTPTSTDSIPSTTPLTVSGLYFATLTDNFGCESINKKNVFAQIISFQQTTLDPTNDYNFCKNANKKISDLETSPYTSSDIVWLDANKIVQSSNSALIPGTYYAAETNSGCVSDKISAPINVVFSSPETSISASKLPTCSVGNGSLIIINSDKSYTYKWYKNGVALPDSNWILNNLPDDQSAKYAVAVTDSKGCTSFATGNNVGDTTYSFTNCDPALPPHIITPNGDGKNDKFILHYDEKYPKCELLIYNRWGALVYTSQIPYKDDWDGKSNASDAIGKDVLPSATYFYIIDKGDGTTPDSGYIELVK